MKIAVASMDGVTLSPHFGRSTCFIIFTITNGKIVTQEVRDNTYTAHSQGLCSEGAEHPHDQHHSHANIVAFLRDCQAILCQGMGWRAAEELQAAGIRAAVIGPENSAQEAVEAFLSGKTPPAMPFCCCHDQLPGGKP